MKRIIALVLCLCLTLGVACTALADQTLTVFRTNEPATIDRVGTTIDEAGKFILFDASEPLFRINNGVVEASGCESYTYDEATMTYTFKLRENYWEDGVKVTAADYLYSFQRMVDPANAYGYISDLYCIVNAEAIYTGEKEISELGVTAPDEDTLVIQMNESNPAFLAVAPMYPQRQDFVEACGDSYGTDADKFISCGPFKLTAWEHNSYATLEKNPLYWDAENVQLETVTVLFSNDSNALYSAMLNGTLDYFETRDPDYIAAFEADSNFAVSDRVTAALVFVLFNCEDELLQNTKIRQALSLAIDRELFVDMMYSGLYTPAYSISSPAVTINGVSLRDFTTEPLKDFAESGVDPKQLFIEGLEELGLDPDPSKITLTFSISSSTTADDTIALYQAMWGETLGVNVEANISQWATFWSDCKAGDFQIGTLAWSNEVDMSFLYNLFLSNNAQMPCFYYTEEYDEIVNKANSSMDDNERLSLYAQAEKLITVDYASIAPLCYQVQKAVLRSNVKGWDYNVFSTMGHKNVYIEE